ncbi:MAG: DUF1651 domain-containing protein [Leptolyngbyaceae cyanobacterium SM1_4_3]|nr:DUF1651 domain-containing protein [Leptolyngbyaceae cyanobacterium SM1_4_3]
MQKVCPSYLKSMRSTKVWNANLTYERLEKSGWVRVTRV